MSIFGFTITSRRTAFTNLYPNKVLSRHYLCQLHYFSLLTPTSLPQPPPSDHSLQVFYRHSSPFSESTSRLFQQYIEINFCAIHKDLFQLWSLFPTLPGQRVPPCSLLRYLLLLLLSPVPYTRTARHIKQLYLYISRYTNYTKYAENVFQRESILPMQNNYGTHLKMLKKTPKTIT